MVCDLVRDLERIIHPVHVPKDNCGLRVKVMPRDTGLYFRDHLNDRAIPGHPDAEGILSHLVMIFSDDRVLVSFNQGDVLSKVGTEHDPTGR